MLEFVFGMLTNSALLLFGVFASAAILGIPFNKKNAAVLLAFCIFVNLLQFWFYSDLGLEGARWYYPLHTHLPSLLFFTLHFKRRVPHSIYAILSAYLLPVKQMAWNSGFGFHRQAVDFLWIPGCGYSHFGCYYNPVFCAVPVCNIVETIKNRIDIQHPAFCLLPV